MDPFSMALLVGVLVVGIGGSASTLYFRQKLSQSQQELEKQQKNVKEYTEEEAIARASAQAKSITLDAKNEALDITSKAQEKSKELYNKLEQQEKQLDSREKNLIKRRKDLDSSFDEIEKKERSVEQSKKDVRAIRSKLEGLLEKTASMTRDEAKKQLLEEVEEDLTKEIAKRIKEAEMKVKQNVDERSRDILVDAMVKSATDYVAETTTTTMDIPNEDIKGKIIGKEGRNIRTFERHTGVDVIVDEAPEQITISCFDPIRREVGVIAMERLLKDGRIHPGTIEETIEKVKKEIGKTIRKTGEEVAYKTGFNDLPIEIIRLLGRFKYRYSYGQNLIKHTYEMVNLGETIASEIGADVRETKLACLLHDVGKVMTHEIEGKPHHHISGDIVRKYLKNEHLANAVEAHHGDIDSNSVEAEIVKIADAISGARPGARRDNYDEYVKRIRALEDIAMKHDDVEEAFAIHAGREVRVIVKPKSTTDKEVTVIARAIAKEIEDTQQYPGTVTVTAIKELRIQEKAK